MYDIDLNKLKSDRKQSLWLIIPGIAFTIIIIVAIIVHDNLEKSLDSQTMSISVDIVESTNSDGDDMYSPTYNYEVNGEQYSCASTTSTSFKPSTKNGVVYYDSKDPSKCETDYSRSNFFWAYVAIALPVLLLVLGIYQWIKTSKTSKKIKILNQSGKLVKGLRYRPAHESIDGENKFKPIGYVVADYQLPTGENVTLSSSRSYKSDLLTKHDTIDLLIDESNPKIYYLDFNINRKGGNKPEDNYKDPYSL